MKRMKDMKEFKNINMKKLFRRNQIIVTTLAIMIAAAGYLNYAGKRELEAGNDVYEVGVMDISDEDILAENQNALREQGNLLDILSLDQDLDDIQQLAEAESVAEQFGGETGTESGLDNPGEAVLTSGMSVTDYIAGVQLNREQIRAKNKDTLLSIINNSNIEEAAKQQAIQEMIAMTEIAEKENAAETLLKAKGFSDPVVSVTSGKVDVVVNASSITDAQRAQIEDVVKRKTEVGAESIVITLLNLEE